MPEMFDDDERDESQPEQPTEEPAAAEEPAAEPEEPAAEEPAAEFEEPAAEEPAASEEEPAAEAEEPAPVEEPAAEEAPAAEEVTPSEEPAAEDSPEDRGPPVLPKGVRTEDRSKRKPDKQDEPEVIPGADLEPDLVLEESSQAREADPYADPASATSEGDGAEGGTAEDTPAPVPTTVLELAADARYLATGKRKRAVARVIIKPGSGSYSVNGRDLDEFFPRPTLQRVARGPLETVGQEERMDVVAKIHGGGVSSQAGALRHGIARALVEADPNLRGELKRHGYLTRDPRVKERKKAGLKKARKRPQFSKR
jgi:small subunit ribosomal protein S9